MKKLVLSVFALGILAVFLAGCSSPSGAASPVEEVTAEEDASSGSGGKSGKSGGGGGGGGGGTSAPKQNAPAEEPAETPAEPSDEEKPQKPSGGFKISLPWD
jgi:hypothetical protein